MKRRGSIRIGTAGWVVPKEAALLFSDAPGSHLERYARTFACVEINSSFYRHHQASSYRKWAAHTPPGFRFSVKLSKVFTHERRLENPGTELNEVLSDVKELGVKLGCILVQLPPSLKFESKKAGAFFAKLRKTWPGHVALEPRHASWLSTPALKTMNDDELSFVISDPGLAAPDGLESKLLYYRLHGSPVRYRSRYTVEALAAYANEMFEAGRVGKDVWCIFDNTMFAHAAVNASELVEILKK
ncbi:MAG: DUF72 domain-containing protein [Bdellovibrionota bacterium]